MNRDIRTLRKEFECMKKEKDALNKVLWDPRIDKSDFKIVVIDRMEGPKEISFGEFEVLGDYIKKGDAIIPMHRIRKVIYRDTAVWDKRRG